ncbi:hypothetical protein ABEB36_002018 [Hypothenemus hampei]|uniref:Uncharacterized protein n=1 Tax=Hypothenemus hampei TaxID=57062 RepID=A0ABD1FH41_HYPHA
MKQCQSHNRTQEPAKRGENSAGSGKISKPPTTDAQLRYKLKEKPCSETKSHTNHHYLRGNVNKQQNLSLENVLEPTLQDVKTKATKQRSRSTVSERQPWGQLLTKHTGVESESVFGKFDPLRTLHFLARELQTHMQARLPDETSLQEIIKAMHSALKRVPPEVASTVQLQQQSIELIPKLSEESLKGNCCQKKYEDRRTFNEFQRLIEGSTMKLEASCKQLEVMCGQLKDEKYSLERLLQSEKENCNLLQKRVEELIDSHKKLSMDLCRKDEELDQLKSNMRQLEGKLQERNDCNDVIAELKKSKLNLERENKKLEHQLRLCAIEKEKYLAILAVRDRQIYEIRNEMTQLQQSVNEQLVELHNYATASVPSNNDDNRNMSGISSIWLSELGLEKGTAEETASDSEEDLKINNEGNLKGM